MIFCLCIPKLPNLHFTTFISSEKRIIWVVQPTFYYFSFPFSSSHESFFFLSRLFRGKENLQNSGRKILAFFLISLPNTYKLRENKVSIRKHPRATQIQSHNVMTSLRKFASAPPPKKKETRKKNIKAFISVMIFFHILFLVLKETKESSNKRWWRVSEMERMRRTDGRNNWICP